MADHCGFAQLAHFMHFMSLSIHFNIGLRVCGDLPTSSNCPAVHDFCRDSDSVTSSKHLGLVQQLNNHKVYIFMDK